MKFTRQDFGAIIGLLGACIFLGSISIDGQLHLIDVVSLFLMLFGAYLIHHKKPKIKKGVLYLPEKWQQVILKIPETGIGYHILDFTLDDGTIISHQIIINGMYPKGSLTAEQIDRIKNIKPTKL